MSPKLNGGDSGPADSPARQAGPGTCELIDRAVVFHLGSQRYGIPIDRVSEIQQIVAFSDVPADGLGVMGMVNLRGEVVPAIDVRSLVGMEERAYSLDTPMIIVRAEEHRVALIVDDVQDVLVLPAGCLQAASPMHALSSKMIGVARLDDGLVYLLDVDRMLAQSMLAEEAGDD